jgi:uncharacterized repeat protein (TIGR03803 family)
MTTNGAISTLASFPYLGPNTPLAGLVLGNDGNFYGSTSTGGGFAATIFAISPGGFLTNLVTLSGPNGAGPVSSLILGSDGNFYGTAGGGGSYGKGTIFQMTTNGILTTLVSFNGTNGSAPLAALALGNDGNFYGTTSAGGIYGQGTIFEMNTNWMVTSLVSFSGGNGSAPLAGLTLGSDGNFYGTTSAGGTNGVGTVFRMGADGTFTSLVSFGNNGNSPQGPLAIGQDGRFYGTTFLGGSNYAGTVFAITTNGVFSSLVCFNSTNGGGPVGALAQAGDGNLYGATSFGGADNAGTVFRMTTAGALTSMFSFTGSTFTGVFPNGRNPEGGLVVAADSSFYGTTYDSPDGYGHIFRITTNGFFTNLAALAVSNGYGPMGSLIQGNDGNFYGISIGGIIKATTNGVVTKFASFNGVDGTLGPAITPGTGLIIGPDGNFYGTAYSGGVFGNTGTVFKLTPNGTVSVLQQFSTAGGQYPATSLTLGPDGYFYGTTSGGNLANADVNGTIFKISTNGTFTNLVVFAGTNGSNPQGALTLGNDGNFYGTTYGGGPGGGGEIFRLGLPPEIMIQPASHVGFVSTPTTFTVSVVGGLPLYYQWLQNGVAMSDGEGITGTATANLELTDASRADAQGYSVIITNNYGAITSSVANLIVLAPGGCKISSFQPGVLRATTNSFTCAGTTNMQYIMQYSTNLLAGGWFPLSTNFPNSNGLWTVVDRAATNAQRYYRIVTVGGM